MPLRARIYIALVLALGLAAVGYAIADWGSVMIPARMAVYVALTALASLIKLRLPGLDGTYSLNAVLVLAGVVYFTLPETVAAAIAGVLVQSYARAERRPSVLQTLFNAANETLSVAVAFLSLRYMVNEGVLPFRPALLAAAAAVYFVLNTSLVSGVLALLGGGEFREVNKQWYIWSFPYYLVGAAAAGVMPLGGGAVDFEACALLIPLAYLTHFFCGIARRPSEPAAEEEHARAAVPASAKAFTAAVTAGAAVAVAFAARGAQAVNWELFLSLLALAAITATWKVRLPGTTGTISVHYVIVLAAVAQLGMLEALAVAAAGPLVQTLWRPKVRPKAIQVVFNAAAMSLSTGAAYYCCRVLGGVALGASVPTLLAAAALVQFVTNTFLVAVVVSLAEQENLVALWRRVYFWAFPIYMVGAAAAALMVSTARVAGWAPSLLIVPLMAMIQYSYRLHLAGRMAPGKPAQQVREAT